MRLYNPHLKSTARQLRSNMTPAEKILWNIVKRKQLLDVQFYRQKIIGSYILDFYAPTVNLVIELDGDYHLQQEIQKQDNFRDKFLQELNLQTVRFTNIQVLNYTPDVRDILINFIKKNRKKAIDGSVADINVQYPLFQKGVDSEASRGIFHPHES